MCWDYSIIALLKELRPQPGIILHWCSLKKNKKTNTWSPWHPPIFPSAVNNSISTHTQLILTYSCVNSQLCARSAQVLLNNQWALPVSCGMNVPLEMKHEWLTGCGCSAIQQLKHNQNSLMISSPKVLLCQRMQRVWRGPREQSEKSTPGTAQQAWQGGLW